MPVEQIEPTRGRTGRHWQLVAFYWRDRPALARAADAWLKEEADARRRRRRLFVPEQGGGSVGDPLPLMVCRGKPGAMRCAIELHRGASSSRS